MFTRKISFLAKQSFSRGTKTQAHIIKAIQTQHIRLFSIFRSSSRKPLLKTPTNNLPFLPKYSFSNHFSSKRPLQVTCLDDLAEMTLNGEEKMYCQHHLNVYAKCDNFIALSQEDASEISDVFDFMAQQLINNENEARALEYLQENVIFKKICRQDEAKNYLEIFFLKWELDEKNGLDEIVQQATLAFEQEFVEDPHNEELKTLGFDLELAKTLSYAHFGKFEKALESYMKVSPQLAEHVNGDYVQRFPEVHQEMARLYLRRDEVLQAVECCDRSIEIAKAVYEEGKDLAVFWDHVRELLCEFERYHEALPFVYQQMKYLRKILPADSEDVIITQRELSILLYEVGYYPLALKNFKTVLEYFENNMPDELSRIADLHYRMALCSFKENKVQEAFESFGKGRDLLEKVYGEKSEAMVYMLLDWGEILVEKDETKVEAQKVVEQAIGIQEKIQKENAVMRTNLLNAFGKTLYAQEKFSKAEKVFEESRGIMESAGYKNWKVEGEIYLYKGLIASEYKDWEKSIKNFEAAKNVKGATGGFVAECFENIGKVKEKQGLLEEAFQEYGQAFTIYKKACGHDHRKTQACFVMMSKFVEKHKNLQRK